MSWNLKRSRGIFLDKYKFRNDRSFWWHLAQMLSESGVPSEATDAFLHNPERVSDLEWSPTQSNCPDLAAVVEGVGRRLPADWRSLAEQVFVGITPGTEVQAQAWNREAGGIIEISVQFLWLLEAYAAVFDEFRHSLTHLVANEVGALLAHHPSPDYGDMTQAWARLDAAMVLWRDGDILYPGEPNLVRLPPGREWQAVSAAVTAAESFIVCHELAHHVLGHTVKNAKSRTRRARELLHPLLAAIPAEYLAGLGGHARKEVEADVLALAINANYFGDPSLPEIYGALLGAILVLAAVGHKDQHWTTVNTADSHPPLEVRAGAILAGAIDWFKGMPRGPYGDHPLDLASQLIAFTEFMIAGGSGAFASNDKKRVTEYLQELVYEHISTQEWLQSLHPRDSGAPVFPVPEQIAMSGDAVP